MRGILFDICLMQKIGAVFDGARAHQTDAQMASGTKRKAVAVAPPLVASKRWSKSALQFDVYTRTRHQNMSEQNTDYVSSLAKGLAVMAHLANTKVPQTLSEVADALNIPRATARRFLLTLEKLGYAESKGRRFGITAKVLQLGYGYFTSNPLTHYIDAELERITAQSGNTSFASVYDDGEITLIGRQIGRLVEAPQIVGSKRPAYCTSMGRIFLSSLEDAAIDAVLERHPPKALTSSTKVTKAAIMAEIRKTRKLDYALVENETAEGLRAIAVPVRKSTGEVILAIDVVQIAQSESRKTALQKNLPILKEAAERLGAIASHVNPA